MATAQQITERFINAVGQYGQRALESSIKSVVVESEYTPRLTVDSPLVQGSSKPNPVAEAILKIVKPRVTVNFAAGLPPVVIAPYGQPGSSKWPIIQVVGIASGIFFAGVLLRGFIPRRGQWRELKAARAARAAQKDELR